MIWHEKLGKALFRMVGWGVTGLYVFVPVLTLVVVLLVFAYWGLDSYFHTTTNDAKYSQFLKALQGGDSEQALIFAQQYEKFGQITRQRKNHLKYRPWDHIPTETDVAYIYSLAWELNGDTERSLTYLEDDPKLSAFNVRLSDSLCFMEPPIVPFTRTRLLYKNGNKNEAFIEYCHIADYYLSESYLPPESFKRSTSDERSKPEYYKDKLLDYAHLTHERKRGVLLEFRKKLTLEYFYGLNRLNAFKTYDEFLNFVKEEYKALGEPAEYSKQIEFFEDVDAEREYINPKLRPYWDRTES